MGDGREDIIAKLMKIRSLAKGGIDGEREAAQRMLHKLMIKHGIHEDELESEGMEYHSFAMLKHEWHPKLASQIAYAVLGTSDIRTDKRRRTLYVNCTNAQAIEIAAMVDFYTDAYLADLAIFHRAFVNKNHLFPPDDMDRVEDGDKCLLPRMTDEERDKIINMMGGVTKREYYRQIEG